MAYPDDFPITEITQLVDGQAVNTAVLQVPVDDLDANLQYLAGRGSLFGPLHKDGLTLKWVNSGNSIEVSEGGALSSRLGNGGAPSITDRTLLASVGAAGWSKQINATWAAGNNTATGGHHNGSPVAGGIVHVFLLMKATSSVAEVGFDEYSDGRQLLANGVVSAAGYTHCRRIGSVWYNGTTIDSFVQRGNQFLFGTPKTSPSYDTHTSTQQRNLTDSAGTAQVIPQVSGAITGIANIIVRGNDTGSPSACYITASSPLAVNVTAPSSSTYNLLQYNTDSNDTLPASATRFELPTDNSKIAVRCSSANTGVHYTISTLGWRDEFSE